MPTARRFPSPGTLLIAFLVLASSVRASSVPRSSDLVVLDGNCEAADFAQLPKNRAGLVEALPVRCWERDARQEAMQGPMLDSVLRIKRNDEPRQISREEIESLLKASGGNPKSRACAASAHTIRHSGGTVTYQGRPGSPHRCIVSGLSPEALREIFHKNPY